MYKESEMPEQLERALKKTARKRGFGKKRAGAYVYGTMRKTGWKPGGKPAKKSKITMKDIDAAISERRAKKFGKK